MKQVASWWNEQSGSKNKLLIILSKLWVIRTTWNAVTDCVKGHTIGLIGKWKITGCCSFHCGDDELGDQECQRVATRVLSLR
jgi:hypothetical protein